MKIPINLTDKRFQHFFLLLIVLIGTSLRLYNLGTKSIWMDESVIIEEIAAGSYEEGNFNSDIKSILKIVGTHISNAIGHPPAYFVFLYLWSHLGKSEFVLRFFSVIFGVLCIPLLYTFIKNVLDSHIALITSLLISISPFHINWSQEIKYFMLFSVIILLAVKYFLNFIFNKNKTALNFFVILMVFALYVHYYAIFILIFANIYILYKCKTQNAKCKMQSEKRKIQNAEHRTQNTDFQDRGTKAQRHKGTESSAFGLQSSVASNNQQLTTNNQPHTFSSQYNRKAENQFASISIAQFQIWKQAQKKIFILYLPWLPIFLLHIIGYTKLSLLYPASIPFILKPLVFIIALIALFSSGLSTVTSISSKIGLLFLMPTILYSAFFFIKGISYAKRKYRESFNFLMMFFLTPIVFILISWLKGNTPITLFRHLIFISPVFYVLLACGLVSIRNNLIKLLSVFFLILFSASCIIIYYLSPKQDWKTAVKFITDNIKKGDIIVIPQKMMTYSFSYYYKNNAPLIFSSRNPSYHTYLMKENSKLKTQNPEPRAQSPEPRTQNTDFQYTGPEAQRHKGTEPSVFSLQPSTNHQITKSLNYQLANRQYMYNSLPELEKMIRTKERIWLVFCPNFMPMEKLWLNSVNLVKKQYTEKIKYFINSQETPIEITLYKRGTFNYEK